MPIHKIPPLAILALSLAVSVWLVVRPSAARRHFAGGLERLAQPFSAGVAKLIWRMPLWVIMVWGAFAFAVEILTALFVVFLVD